MLELRKEIREGKRGLQNIQEDLLEQTVKIFEEFSSEDLESVPDFLSLDDVH
jgi:hypothetical protein